MKSSLSSIFLLLVLPVHLFVMVLYTQNNRSTQLQARRDSVIQQVMNVIHMAQATPWPQLPRAIDALDQSKMRVTIGDAPEHDARAYNLSFWIINRLVPKKADTFKLSLQLYSGKWLNVDAQIMQDSMMPQTFLLIVECIVAVMFFLYLRSINRFIKPLREFQEAAEKLGVDVNTAYFKEYQTGPKVVRETAKAMSRMQKRIQDLLDNRNTMLAAISHDLRTPITRLRLRLEKINDASLTAGGIDDLDEMEQMISDILAFARNDHVQEDKTWLDLNAFMTMICDDLNDIGWDVEFIGLEKRVPAYVRKISLKRAITNIIHNAVKYGGKAKVALSMANGYPKLTIEDNGPGIPKEELEAVFAPFYRCDRSRSRKIAGTGLGLAVAKDAIRANRAEIMLENIPEGGLRVRIIFNNTVHKVFN